MQYDATDIDASRRDIDILTTLGFIYGEYKPSNWFVNTTLSYGQSDYDETTPQDNTLVNLINGSNYVVKGKRLSRMEYELNIGLNAHLTDNVTLGASYMGAYRNKYQEHTGIIRLKYDF